MSNWLRVLIIVQAGYGTHMRHVWVTQGHFVFGWTLFTAMLVVSVWFLARRPGTVPVDGLPQTGRHGIRMAAPDAFQAPAGTGAWRGPVGAPGNRWQPEFVGAHSQWYFAYQGPSGHNVEMVAIGYPLQSQGRELVNEENSLFGAGSREPTAETTVTLGNEEYMELVTVDEQGQRSVSWSVYDIGGREFGIPLLSQLWYGVRSPGRTAILGTIRFQNDAMHLAMPRAPRSGVSSRQWVRSVSPPWVACRSPLRRGHYDVR